MSNFSIGFLLFAFNENSRQYLTSPCVILSYFVFLAEFYSKDLILEEISFDYYIYCVISYFILRAFPVLNREKYKKKYNNNT